MKVLYIMKKVNFYFRSLLIHKETIVSFIFSALIVAITSCCIWLLYELFNFPGYFSYMKNIPKILDLTSVNEVILTPYIHHPSERNTNCTIWNCLNIYRCGQNEDERLKVYIYPVNDYIDKNEKITTLLSKEYYQILQTVYQSKYYTSNPNEACLFLPSIDLLNENLLNNELAEKALCLLNFWENGENHILFNMLPGTYPHYSTVLNVGTHNAMIMGGGFDTWSYRDGFDVSIPVWSPLLQNVQIQKDVQSVRKYLLVAGQINLAPKFQQILHEVQEDLPDEVLILRNCPDIGLAWRCNNELHRKRFKYPQILTEGSFCFLGRGVRLGQPDLLEILSQGCIPVIAIDNYVLPFEDVIDWSLVSVRIRESEVQSVVQKLENISKVKMSEMRKQIFWIYDQYFKDIKKIVLTTMEILEARIFPLQAQSRRLWNVGGSNNLATHNPLFLPLQSPKSQGFTAVILTYDRIDSLFLLIQKLSSVPSLQCILVVWNNQNKPPPHVSVFPSISKQLKVIQTLENKLSNRFYPYPEIETEAILTIDDDIVMLTNDELEFGFEVWREFPDHIVGFPSRIHVWDNISTRWHYESEWTNQISMVLTGAAFLHKYWSHIYTYGMPGYIKSWVDEHMNCEDIAMNFLVANITNNPPIKVTPRKKFKCPECTNTEMLSADLDHMRERSACIDKFAQIYGRMPLRSVEFRADPVLFRDNFPDKLKRYNDIGNL